MAERKSSIDTVTGIPEIRDNCSLTDEELQRLRLFVDVCKKLSKKSFIKNGRSVRITIRLTPEGLAPTVDGPDEEVVESYLPTLRKFYADDEPTFVPSILNLMSRQVAYEPFRKEVADVRAYWKTVTRTPGDNQLSIRVRRRRLSPGAFLDLWLNGEVFHSDQDKRQELAELKRVFGVAVFGFVVDGVMELTKVVNRTYLLVKTVLRSIDSVVRDSG